MPAEHISTKAGAIPKWYFGSIRTQISVHNERSYAKHPPWYPWRHRLKPELNFLHSGRCKRRRLHSRSAPSKRRSGKQRECQQSACWVGSDQENASKCWVHGRFWGHFPLKVSVISARSLAPRAQRHHSAAFNFACSASSARRRSCLAREAFCMASRPSGVIQ